MGRSLLGISTECNNFASPSASLQVQGHEVSADLQTSTKNGNLFFLMCLNQLLPDVFPFLPPLCHTAMMELSVKKSVSPRQQSITLN